MKWSELLDIVGMESVFTSGMLLAGAVSRGQVQRQLSRWVGSGRLIQLRRGLYALGEPYRKVKPHPFVLSNRIKGASYVSLQSALAYYEMIPEHVPVVTAVTTGRPERVDTPLGSFIYRHVGGQWFGSYENMDVGGGQEAFVATREKALLDLIYLTPGSASTAYLGELRLQNLGALEVDGLLNLAESRGGRKLVTAARRVVELKRRAEAYRSL